MRTLSVHARHGMIGSVCAGAGRRDPGEYRASKQRRAGQELTDGTD